MCAGKVLAHDGNDKPISSNKVPEPGSSVLLLGTALTTLGGGRALLKNRKKRRRGTESRP
jgi:hypothetical protein